MAPMAPVVTTTPEATQIINQSIIIIFHRPTSTHRMWIRHASNATEKREEKVKSNPDPFLCPK